MTWPCLPAAKPAWHRSSPSAKRVGVLTVPTQAAPALLHSSLRTNPNLALTLRKHVRKTLAQDKLLFIISASLQHRHSVAGDKPLHTFF